MRFSLSSEMFRSFDTERHLWLSLLSRKIKTCQVLTPGVIFSSARKASVKDRAREDPKCQKSKHFSALFTVITQRISRFSKSAECGASSTEKHKVKSPRLTQNTRLLQISLLPNWLMYRFG